MPLEATARALATKHTHAVGHGACGDTARDGAWSTQPSRRPPPVHTIPCAAPQVFLIVEQCLSVAFRRCQTLAAASRALATEHTHAVGHGACGDTARDGARSTQRTLEGCAVAHFACAYDRSVPYCGTMHLGTAWRLQRRRALATKHTHAVGHGACGDTARDGARSTQRTPEACAVEHFAFAYDRSVPYCGTMHLGTA